MVKSFSHCYEAPGNLYEHYEQLEFHVQNNNQHSKHLRLETKFYRFFKRSEYPKSIWRKVRFFRNACHSGKVCRLEQWFRCRGLEEHNRNVAFFFFGYRNMCRKFTNWFLRIVVSCVVEYEDKKHAWYSNTGL